MYLFFFWPCPVACGILVPLPGIDPAPPAMEAQSLNHWTAREVPPSMYLLNLEFVLFMSQKKNSLLISLSLFSLCRSLIGYDLLDWSLNLLPVFLLSVSWYFCFTFHKNPSTFFQPFHWIFCFCCHYHFPRALYYSLIVLFKIILFKKNLSFI